MITKIIDKKFNYIIADEAHYLKNRSAKRTMSLTPILQRAKRVVLLTGTPILAKPMEIYPLLHILRRINLKALGNLEYVIAIRNFYLIVLLIGVDLRIQGN